MRWQISKCPGYFVLLHVVRCAPGGLAILAEQLGVQLTT